MKRIFLLVALSLCLLSACSKSGVKDIRVTSFEVVSLTPKGLKDIDAVFRIGLYNPMVAFEVSDVKGTLKYDGQDALFLTADQLIVAGKTEKVYTVPVHGTIDSDFNPFQLLGVLNGSADKKMDLDKLTLDISLRPALRGGLGKKIEVKDIRLSGLIDKK